MLIAQLQQITKNWDPWHLRKILDFRDICTIEVSNSKEKHSNNRKSNSLVRHIGGECVIERSEVSDG